MDGWTFDTLSSIIGFVIGALVVMALGRIEMWRGKKK